MRNLLVFLFIWFALYIIGYFVSQKDNKDFEFMSKSHTNICRGVAAIIIVFQHVAGGFGVRYLTPLGGIGVAIFLILSGYGLNESFKRKGIGGGYWKTKIIRVLLPYILVCVVVIICDAFTKNEMTIPYYWYIDFMLLWYLFFYAVIRIPNLYSHRYAILGIISLLVFIVGCAFNNGLRAEQAVSFFIGVWISDNYKKAKEKIIKNQMIAVLLIVGIALLGCKQVPAIRALENTAMWYGIQLLMKISVAIAFIGLTYKFSAVFNNRMILNIGLVSYELYLVHYQLLSLPSRGIAGILGFVTISLLGAWMIHGLVAEIRNRFIR